MDINELFEAQKNTIHYTTNRLYLYREFQFFFLKKKLALVNFYRYMRKPSRREPRGLNL